MTPADSESKEKEGTGQSASVDAVMCDPKLSVFVGFIACCFAVVSFFGIWESIDDTRMMSIKGAEAVVRMRRTVTGIEAGLFGLGTLLLGVLSAVAAFLSLSPSERRLPVKVQIVSCIAGVCLVLGGLAMHDVGLPPGPALALGSFLIGALAGVWTLLSRTGRG